MLNLLLIAATWTVVPAESPVSFLATGKPGFLKIRGEGASLSGAATDEGGKLSGSFKVALSALKTGIDLRDEHMKEKYLETGKHPEASLTLDPIAVDLAKGGDDLAFTGKLTVKGVEKPVSGTFDLEPEKDGAVKGKAVFKVVIEDYPIGVPSHLGVTVAESVEVTAAFRGTRTN